MNVIKKQESSGRIVVNNQTGLFLGVAKEKPSLRDIGSLSKG